MIFKPKDLSRYGQAEIWKIEVGKCHNHCGHLLGLPSAEDLRVSGPAQHPSFCSAHCEYRFVDNLYVLDGVMLHSDDVRRIYSGGSAWCIDEAVDHLGAYNLEENGQDAVHWRFAEDAAQARKEWR